MGRRVPRAQVTGSPERGIDHGRHGPLAVGPGNDDRGERRVRVAERLAERRDVREPELHAEALEAEKEVDGRPVRPERN